MTPESRFDDLPREECLELLASRHVGRLAVVVDIHPAIFPVNYELDGDQVVFRTDDGTKFTHASGQPVAFEVDEIDEATRSGWSVHVWGRASEVTAREPRDVRARLFSLPLHPWPPGTKPHYVRILPVSITGRRVNPPISTATYTVTGPAHARNG